MLTENTPETETTAPLSVVPEPDPIQVLQNEKLQLQETIDRLTDQCQTHQSVIAALERDKTEIHDRLKAHEDNQFSMVLANLESGSVAQLASEQINALADLVDQRQEPGKLALTITLKPFNAEGGQTATAEIKVTEPKSPKSASVFFWQNGKLSRRNERQENLKF